MQTDRRVYFGMLFGVLFVTVLAVLLVVPSAHAADNSACMTCHSVITNFTVTPVDRDTACAKCHIPGLVGSHPYHQSGSYCGSVCHSGWGDTLMTAVPSHYDSAAGASFASATSKATSPALLHVIHANPRWPGSLDRPASACSSCHAAAACSACHEGAIDPAHATHGSSTYPQWSGRVGHGVVGADQTVKTAGTQTNQCATSACHDLEGTRSLSVRLHEDYSHAVGQNTFDPTVANTVTTTGTWLTRFNSQRTAGRFMFSATAGATHSLTFTGTRVELISDTDPYRGRAEIFIDNVSQGIIDCYAPSTTAQAVVFVADDLEPGEHTIRVRVLGQKQAASRAAYVVVDAYKVYSGIPDSIAPECLSCHGDKAEDHGGSFDHIATGVTGIYPGPDPDYSCTACHSLNMFTEHSRTSSASKAAGCSACHTTYAAFNLDTYDGTCAWSECHQAANGHEPHVAASTLHIAADANTQVCRDCHGSDLAVVHEGAPNRCLTCHGPTLYPTTTSCIDAVCHATNGVVSIETHPAPAHDASGTDAGVARTGGYACSTCHVLELVDEHTKPSSRGTGDTDIACVSCHGASYFPAGWNDGAPTTNTCVACHDPAGAADAGIPHTATGYGISHDLRPYGANASSCGTLAGAYCHGGASALLGDVAFADLLHDASKPGTATCTSCHATNTATPQVHTCSTCHATGHDLAGSHSATPARFAANADCTGCHTAYGDLTAHTKGCAGCHGNATLTAGNTRYLNGTFSGLCTDCHTGTVLGTIYDPTDPNHYDDGKHTAQITGLTTTIGTASGLCTDCHASGLKAEHAFTLSAGAVGCIACHTNATLGSATVIAQDWPTKLCSGCHGVQHNSLADQHDLSASATALGCGGTGCHNGSDIASLHAAATVTGPPAKSGCNVCHASADIALAATGCDAAGCHEGMTAHAHSLDLAGSNYNDATQTGCTNSGAGCHGAYAAAEPTYLDFHPDSGCTDGPCHTAGNHDAPQFDDPNTCQNCHGDGALLYDNARRAVPLDLTDPNGHYIVGSHTASAGLGTVSASGSASATCSTCHDVTLRDAHGAVGGGFSSTTKGTLVTCYECHNYNAAVSEVVNADWAAGTCATCHNAGVMPGRAQHGATAPAVAGTQPAAPNACTRSGCHSFGSLNLHALHRNASGGCALAGCHAKNKDMGTATRSCGTGGCHGGYESGAHAISNGGKACDSCHSALVGMVDDTSSYHHVLDHSTPFMAPGSGGSYPTSKTEMACVSCHVDHDKYDPLPGGQGKAYSLRNSATVANPTAVNTDDGLCLSCHSVSLARNTTGQKANTIQESRIWRVDATMWQGSPHNYTVPGDFNDGSTFYANCAKCHGTLGGTLSSGKFAVHFSPEQRLLNALGDTTVYTVNEEQMCFRCHSRASDFAVNGGTQPGVAKPSDNVDWYGIAPMKESNIAIYKQMMDGTNIYGHKPHQYQNIHLLDEVDEDWNYISANKHVECADCHNHHVVGTARHEWGTTNEVSAALKGVTGVGYTTLSWTTNFPNITRTGLTWKTEATYEYEICFKCHSSANTNLAGWGGRVFDNATVNNWTNVAQDFAVGNNSRHPVVAPLTDTDPSVNYGTSKLQSTQLIDIWAPGDTMYCSDCHGDPNAPLVSDPNAINVPQGPHGSSVRYSLRGPRTDWPTRKDTGNLITLGDMLNTSYDGTFCANCHPGIRVNKAHTGNTAHRNAACIRCHILVPHGGKISRTMGDRSTMPARLAYQGNRANMYVESFRKSADPTGYSKNSCNVSTDSGCSSHSTGNNTSAGFENW